mmetsp:Transcript_6827/g.16147  ORF Transcript_6827/g.16147 Transcript_6827/m.16147 type:complete len:205 (+) Transcript_6827:432-1046(+)
MHQLGDAGLLCRGGLHPQRHLMELQQVLRHSRPNVHEGFDGEVLLTGRGIDEEMQRPREHSRGIELRCLLLAVEGMDDGGSCIDLVTRGEPADDHLTRRDFLSQLQHGLVIVLVNGHALIVLLVRHWKAVGDVHCIAFTNPTQQGADGSRRPRRPPHVGIQDLEHRDGVHPAAQRLLDATLLHPRRDVEALRRSALALLVRKTP